jgi:fructose-1,6-bisphosphatase/inositol monophosphatase family enzyme
VDPDSLLTLFDDVVAGISQALADHDGWHLADTVPGQYTHDVVADDVAVAMLLAGGVGVFSEETGLHEAHREVVVVVDPVDGSTNASRGIPWYATSLCAVDAQGPLASVVTNLASGERYAAIRGGGATRDGHVIAPSGCERFADALVVLSDLPPARLGWGQYRTNGASALDLCLVASGAIDGFIDCGRGGHAPWDYLGAQLVCTEAGAVITEARGRDLVVLEPGERRLPVAAATPALLDEMVAARATF